MPMASETGSAGTACQLFADFAGELGKVDGMHAQVREECGRNVDGEVIAGGHGAGGDEGKDADERFGEHGSVTDEAGFGLLVDELGGGAGGDQRMEAGDGSAGDGDKEEGEELAWNDRASAVDIRREGWELQAGVHDENGCYQGCQRAEFFVGGKIVARLQ